MPPPLFFFQHSLLSYNFSNLCLLDGLKVSLNTGDVELVECFSFRLSQTNLSSTWNYVGLSLGVLRSWMHGCLKG